MTKVKNLIFRLEEIGVDRTQYKPYSHKLTSENVYVQIPIPEDEWVETKEGQIVITLDGLSTILSSVADTVDEVQQNYINSFHK